MRYFLDTEFNGWNGDLLSLALVPDNLLHPAFYAVVKYDRRKIVPWVNDNVLSHLHKMPGFVKTIRCDHHDQLPWSIQHYFSSDKDIEIVTDWPDDVAYFSKALITKPGEMITTAQTLRFRMVRVDAYPTRLDGAVQHNAWWDAMALRQKLIDENYWADAQN